jgi:hypothetical protein
MAAPRSSQPFSQVHHSTFEKASLNFDHNLKPSAHGAANYAHHSTNSYINVACDDNGTYCIAVIAMHS